MNVEVRDPAVITQLGDNSAMRFTMCAARDVAEQTGVDRLPVAV